MFVFLKVTVKHWNVWKTHLEETKDRRLQPLAEVVLQEHRSFC